MKKTIILLALAIFAGASCTEAIAKDKKKKKNDEVITPVKEIVTLSNKSDSISYASGQSFTRGMMDYVIQTLNVDSAYIPSFVAGLKEALSQENTPEIKAKAAGEQIASMVRDRMMPNIVQQLEGTDATLNAELFKRGFIDAVEKDASIFSVEEAAKYSETEMKRLSDMKIATAKAAGVAWLEENAKKEGVQTLPSGLQYRVIKQGNGAVATAEDQVTVRYEGKLIDGTVFDSSYERNPNTTAFKPTQVIKGWTEALCMMPEGSEWELYIPESLGYGGRNTGKIPAYSTLIFKVEVVSVKKEEPKKEENTEAKPVVKPALKKASARKPVAKKK